MTKKQLLDTCSKVARSAKLKSYLLAAAGGIITALMYKQGYTAGAADTVYRIGEYAPEEDFDESLNYVEETTNK